MAIRSVFKLPIILFLALLACIQLTKEAVLGIDFGSEFMKISIITPGKPFSIIEDTTSKRKTYSAISFVKGQRIYESDAYAKFPRNLKNTFSHMKKFLGVFANNTDVLDLAKKNQQNYQFIQDPIEGTISIVLQNQEINSEEEQFPLEDNTLILKTEEIVAMILRHAKKLGEKQYGTKVKECVITVPSDWDLLQREIMVRAAKLAGLAPLGLINENSGAALYYGLNRLDEDSIHRVILYNLGAEHLQVSLVEFHAIYNSEVPTPTKMVETVKVLSDDVDKSVSGKMIDQLLCEHLVYLFDSKKERQNKPSIKESPSAMMKLLQYSTKLKEALSAYKEEKIFIENLYEGDDFSSFIERKVLEDLLESHKEQFIQPIRNILAKSGTTLDDVQSLQIIGGAVRVPKVQMILDEFLNQSKVEIGAQLNGDEAMTFGAAFYAANMSHNFKTKPVWFYDGYNFSIKIKISTLDSQLNNQQILKEFILFDEKWRFGGKKLITFKSNENILLEFFQVDEESNEKLYSVYRFINITDISKDQLYKELGTPKLHFVLQQTSLEPILIEMAEAELDEEKLVDIEETSQEKKERLEKEKKEKEEKQEKENNNESENEDEYETDDDEVVDTKVLNNKKKVTKQKLMNFTYYIPLKYEKIYPEQAKYTEEQFNNSRKLLKQFEKHEVFMKKNAEAKNELESYIYVVNDAKNDDDFLKHVRDHELKKLVSLAEEFDDWLYTEEASKSNYTTFNANYNQLYSIYSKVIARKKEWENRPLLLDNLKTSIDSFEKNITDMTSSMPWVNETQKKEGFEMLEILKGFQTSVELDLSEKKFQQDVTVKEKIVEVKIQALEAEIEKLRLIKKPTKSEKAPKTKRKKPETNTTTAEEDNNNNTNNETHENENVTIQIENETLNIIEEKEILNNISDKKDNEQQKQEDNHEEL